MNACSSKSFQFAVTNFFKVISGDHMISFTKKLLKKRKVLQWICSIKPW